WRCRPSSWVPGHSPEKHEKSALTTTYAQNFKDYMRPSQACQEQSVRPLSRGAPRAASGPHLEHDRAPLEPELSADLVLQVALVGEMEVHGLVDGDGEGGRRDPDLRGEENLHGPVALLGLRGVRLSRPREQSVQLARGHALRAGRVGVLPRLQQPADALARARR